MGFASLFATENLSMFDPASPPAASIRDLSVLVLAITGAIFFLVEAVLIYSLVFFRRRHAAGAGEPPQVYGSQPIEIAWTAAPALIVFVIMLVVARTLGELSKPKELPKDAEPLRVTVVGRQWWWEFTYESYGQRELKFVTANELRVPTSNPAGTGKERRPVFLTLKSADVCHSFWVPRLAGKTDLIPGRTNEMWFEASQPDTYLGQCAEYCGTQHANMLLRVKAESPEEFESWLANQEKPAERDPAGSAGKAIFLAQSCVNCHRVRGTPAAGTYAPDLTHLMSRKTLAAGMVFNTEKELTRWIDDPQKVKVGCLMPAFKLSEHDRKLVVEYLLTLR
jgi:cytochrome c oxidase subunit 2